jgi:hypothetical protein
MRERRHIHVPQAGHLAANIDNHPWFKSSCSELKKWRLPHSKQTP